MQASPIQIVLAADSNYVMPLAVAICSAALTVDRQRPIVFTVIQSDINHTSRAKVEASLARTGALSAHVVWIDAPIEHLTDLKIAHKYTTPLTFARLLIPSLLPPDVHKVIYLDCDVAVNADISALWDKELNGKALLAARDSTAKVSDPKGIVNYRDLGIPADAKYFNAGVLVLNLTKWREQAISQQLFAYLREYRDIIQMADQEALNAVLFADWEELEYRWNWQIPWRHCRTGKTRMPWTPESSEKSIIHFTTSEKPWLAGCDYEEKRVFFDVLDRTDWAGWRVPFLTELGGRASRALSDTRDWVGMLRRRLLGRPLRPLC